MSRYFVTFFLKKRMCQYKIDDLIHNSSGGCINETLVFGRRNVYFPVQAIEDSYYICRSKATARIKCFEEEIVDKKKLTHGDLYSIEYRNQEYTALVIDYCYADLSHVAYAMGDTPIQIGRSENSNIVINVNDAVSRNCAVLKKSNDGGYLLEDISGRTGIFVNGVLLNHATKLFSGDEIYIMGTTILYKDDTLWMAKSVRTNGLNVTKCLDVLSPTDGDERDEYARTPRIVRSREEGKIVIDAPPAVQKSKEIPFILQVGPSLTMSMAMLVSLGVAISNATNGNGNGSLLTSLAMAFSMLAGAVLWPVLLRRYNKKQEKTNEEYRKKRYSEYLKRKEEEINNLYDMTLRLLHETMMPAPQVLSEIVMKRQHQLWERMPQDADFLRIRLGTGSRDFQIEIQAPQKGFQLYEDALLDEGVALKDRYSIMKNAPVSISLLEKKVVGVFGDTATVFKSMVMNLASLHSYDEVKLVLVCNRNELKEYCWITDLPHLWSADRSLRYVATTKEEATELFSRLEEGLSSRGTEDEQQRYVPIYIILVLDHTLIDDVPFRAHLTNPQNRIGVSTVFFGSIFSDIPKECVAIIKKTANQSGMYIRNDNNNHSVQIEFDDIEDSLIKQTVASMNRISINTQAVTAIPDRVTFMDMFQAGNTDALDIANHWATNISESSLAAPIGIKTGGELFSLDIHERAHGCHGLVAGTTGSGKSEFLQAYILSMMMHYSPNEVAFVLVDFKGDAMARPFMDSPHLAATISNLSGNTLYRALISLDAEVKRRQNIFNEASRQLGIDMKDINMYHKYFKDQKLVLPLPHLIIVIDEFAQLKSKHPEFMSKLVAISQVGRSLGIHLILATQRPSGVVDQDIWSNSRFKVCLKVLDKQDSNDMIGRPEAALIKQPGRAFVQVGYNEIFETIQSGYSGAPYVEQSEYIDQESISVHMVKPTAEAIRSIKLFSEARVDGTTQIQKIMSVITDLGRKKNLQVKPLWNPPLPGRLLLETCMGSDIHWEVSVWADQDSDHGVVLGMLDIPHDQKQIPYEYDFLESGHLAIYGSSGSGKSTLIQTILFTLSLRFSTQMFHAFILDFGGNGLASTSIMPHCARYVTDSDEQEVAEVLDTLNNVISERRMLFAENHCVSYEAYNRERTDKLPMILLVVDNYSAIREKMYSLEEPLLQVVSAARSCGVFLVVSGSSKNALGYKLLDHISEKIVLNMNDSGAYRDILNVQIPIMPAQGKGRGLVLVDNSATEIQFAVPFDAENEMVRDLRIREVYERMREESTEIVYNAPAVQISSIAGEQHAVSRTVSQSKYARMLPLESTEHSLVVGYDKRTGDVYGFDLNTPTNVFVGTRGDRTLLATLVSRLISDNPDKQIHVITSHEVDDFDQSARIVADVDAWVTEMLEATQEERSKVILVIDGFCDWYDRISDEAIDLMEFRLLEDSDFSIITFDDMERWEDYQSTGAFVFLVRATKGAILGGGIDDSMAYDLCEKIYMVSNEYRNKKLSLDCALVYDGDKIAYAKVEED